ncbi:Hypothetical protein F387_01840, partial [Wohlfahrtiimonas chitiniclastica SH04]
EQAILHDLNHLSTPNLKSFFSEGDLNNYLNLSKPFKLTAF